METPQVPSVPLKDVTTHYKLKIQAELLKKIEYVCKKVPSLEWSGVLFYKAEGSFEENNLVLTAVDMVVQDIGSAGATEFEITTDVACYIAMNELADCQMGLIHSHNNMHTFFSGTDQSTLLQEGLDRNHFLSLIVNNAGVYTAKVTRKIHYKEKFTISYNYETYQGVPVSVEGKEIDSESTVIEAFPLDIEKETLPSPFPELDATLEELRAKNKAKVVPFVPYEGYEGYNPYTRNYSTPVKKEVSAGPANVAQQKFPFQNSQKDSKKIGAGITKWEEGDEVYIEKENQGLQTTLWGKKIPYDKVHYPEESVQDVLRKMIKGSPMTGDNFNVQRFVPNMVSVYDKGFNNLQGFMEWADSYLEFLFWNADSGDLETKGATIEEMNAILAHDLLVEVDKLPENEYLKGYRELLEAYIL